MKKIKNIKKELNDFLKDESGKMSKDNILQIGLGALGSVAAIAMFLPEASSQEGHFSTVPFNTSSADHDSEATRYILLKQVDAPGGEFDDWAPDVHEEHASHDEAPK